MLQTFTFETMTIDRYGQETGRDVHTVPYFTADLGRGVACTMVALPAGTFVMGGTPPGHSELAEALPSRRVQVPAFFMAQHPVTQAQWETVARLPMVIHELHANPAYFQAPELPVESVSWHEAVEFCARLSAHTGQRYRLPHEAEWEYACRAGTTTPFHYGETITSQLANYVGTYTYAAERLGDYRRATTPVGSFAPNAFGLYDMHGNVWEWTADRWQAPVASSKSARDQRDWRTLRGGSWSDAPVNLRAVTRTGNHAESLNRLFGLRVCCAA
jgi:formylglycine-generating enzyme required for sulfatase activity